MFLPTLTSAQNKVSCLAANGVERSEGYTFVIKHGVVTRDSSLVEAHTYNASGYGTTSIYYDSVGVLSKVIKNVFKDDSLIVMRYIYTGGDTTLYEQTAFYYDKDGRMKGAEDVYNSFDATIKGKSRYNKDGQLKCRKVKIKGRTWKDEVYKYDDRGNLIQLISKAPTTTKKVFSYDEKDRRTHSYKVFSDGTRKLVFYSDYSEKGVVTRHVLNTSSTISTLAGRLKMSRKDVLTTERVYGDNRLLKSETQFLNGDLYAKRKYIYN